MTSSHYLDSPRYVGAFRIEPYSSVRLSFSNRVNVDSLMSSQAFSVSTCVSHISQFTSWLQDTFAQFTLVRSTVYQKVYHDLSTSLCPMHRLAHCSIHKVQFNQHYITVHTVVCDNWNSVASIFVKGTRVACSCRRRL